MKVFILWNEDAHVVKLCLSKESAIAYIKEIVGTDQVVESHVSWNRDTQLEADGSRYLLEEMDAS